MGFKLFYQRVKIVLITALDTGFFCLKTKPQDKFQMDIFRLGNIGNRVAVIDLIIKMGGISSTICFLTKPASFSLRIKTQLNTKKTNRLMIRLYQGQH